MTSATAQHCPITRQISELFRANGSQTYGEDITQTEHAVQCAELAVRAGETSAMVTAALLHDIGHLMAATDLAFGNYKHDSIGAEYLQNYFPAEVTEPIRLHAQAKRYLCSTEDGYLAGLSAASLDSLQNQGGLMSEAEQAAYLQEPYALQAIKLRRWDDEGKVLELSSRPFDHYLAHMDAVAFDSSKAIEQQKDLFAKRGYIALQQALDHDDMTLLEQVNQDLNLRSEQILQQVADNDETLSDFYRRNPSELIVVPEIDDAQKVCRYEYLYGCSQPVSAVIVPKLQQFIEQLTGQKFLLFKDKCNAKNPGGGAFEPHQDVIAYDQFKPRYHVTAAIFLDDSTIENGCLHFPDNYLQDLCDLNTERTETPVGSRPVLQSYEGGSKHGNIRQEILDQISWSPVTARKGDVVLFDSYVPHYSRKNESQKPRRAMFFTFNASCDGDYYQAYYDMKHSQFDNPKFHVATPTAHSQREM
ncbi:phytanoyl-CoA dioxygenase family protein [Marinobacterium rhizophilum]|uniref:Phytanoyl-CoA dioxygenase family protein n=1 Tax=Marinobacterium rhizophilum TaxID=420402 RepID=A0ABY5HGS2_9GAMM|nr:phytanoyl-CoA dioxygenase family protein [Marinobacterium rhizophilum]UTW11566.1 phytanoyl-CoA dioxygenase family protein [Marinobacterium rhizophilum]